MTVAGAGKKLNGSVMTSLVARVTIDPTMITESTVASGSKSLIAREATAGAAWASTINAECERRASTFTCCAAVSAACAVASWRPAARVLTNAISTAYAARGSKTIGSRTA
jgi:hypothetical protein